MADLLTADPLAGLANPLDALATEVARGKRGRSDERLDRRTS